jgi:hypothetical protein
MYCTLKKNTSLFGKRRKEDGEFKASWGKVKGETLSQNHLPPHQQKRLDCGSMIEP